jgi:hypothetical protein
MAPLCDEGFGPLTGALLSPVGAKSDIGGIGRSLDEAPEDLPRRDAKNVIPKVIPDDVHQPDEAALPAARNRKCATKPLAVELLIFLLVGDLPPILPVHRRLDEPRFPLIIARRTTRRADCVVRWRNPPLLEIVATQLFLVRGILCELMRSAEAKSESVSKSTVFFAFCAGK